MRAIGSGSTGGVSYHINVLLMMQTLYIRTYMFTDEGWNSQKQLSVPVEKKMKERKRRKKRLLYLHPKLSPGLVSYRLFYRIGTACRKMVH